MNSSLDLPPVVSRLAEAVRASGGRLWVVGGTVRDGLLGRPTHDLDLEVHGLEEADLDRVLALVGTPATVGRSFEVRKLRVDGLELDIALPPEAGTEGLAPGVEEGADPLRSLRLASRRRDLTINAIAQDPLTDELFDPWGGAADAAAGVLRQVDDGSFSEDPLRVLRAARFMGTLGFGAAPELTALCARLDLGSCAVERVEGELARLLLEAPAPGVALAWLDGLGSMRAVHPCLGGWADAERQAALDRAAGLRGHAGGPPKALALMLAILLEACQEAVPEVLEHLQIVRRGGHHVGRAVTTILEQGLQLPEPCTDTHLRLAAEDLEAGLWTLACLARHGTSQARDAWLRTHALGVARGPLPGLLGGRQLHELGVPAGPDMGALLREVRQAQLEGKISTTREARALAQRLWSLRPQPDSEEPPR